MPKLRLLAPSQKPETPIEWLAARVRDYLYLSDPSVLYTLMGAVAANMIQGYPVWLMLIGAPSCGKTSLLNSLLGLPNMHESASITGEAAFLSGTGKKDRAKDATGGLLRQVGDHGGVVLNDFTSIISLQADKLKEVLGVMREVYSGRWTRDIGGEGGRKLHWEGRIAFLGGVTSEIDRHHAVNASLGERWLYCRYEAHQLNGFAQAMKALSNGGKEKWQDELRDLIAGFFAGQSLSFREQAPNRGFTDAEKVRLITMSAVAARCRSAVVRDPYSKDIVGARETEFEGRLATALGQLLLGMDAIGVREEWRWKLVGKVALDSMPRLRRIVVDQVMKRESGKSVEELREVMGCSVSTVRRTAEDLEVHGVVGRENVEGKTIIKASEWMRREYAKGWERNGNGGK